MTTFSGEYRHKVDSKGRISLPSAIRKAVSRDLRIVLDVHDECLLIFDGEDALTSWLAGLFESKGGYDPANAQHVLQRRVMRSRVQPCEVDNSGRILLSPKQRESVGLGKESVIVGNEDHFEVWDAQRWDALIAEADVASLIS